MTVQTIKKQILPILKRRGVVRAAVFGSAARGEMKKSSDVDILVKLKKGKSLFDFAKLKFELEDKLGKKVDLVSYNAIKPRLKDYILRDEKKIYEKRH